MNAETAIPGKSKNGISRTKTFSLKFAALQKFLYTFLENLMLDDMNLVKKLRFSFIFLLFLSAAACGGSGGGTDPDNGNINNPNTVTNNVPQDSPLDLRLYQKSEMTYIGGFRIPQDDFGGANIKYAEGVIGLGKDGNSIYIVNDDREVAEFSIPELVLSDDLSNFNYATNIEPFFSVLDRSDTGNNQSIDRVGGITLIDNSLVINAYEYYDASSDATYTTLVIHDASNPATSDVSGFHKLDGKANASGWISEIPDSLQSALGGTHITGHSSGKPIVSRHSVGPSAFSFSPRETILEPKDSIEIATTTLLDFDYPNVVGLNGQDHGDYLRNNNLNNNMWTHMSRGSYGFIVPSTRSYLVVGHSAGHESGIGYKINGCGGWCPFGSGDYYSYYWIFDMADVLRVESGELGLYDIEPYAYGKFEFSPDISMPGGRDITGGTYDSAKDILYVAIEAADRSQGSSRGPVILAYKVNAN